MTQYEQIAPLLDQNASLLQRVTDAYIRAEEAVAGVFKKSMDNPIVRKGALVAGSLAAMVLIPEQAEAAQDIAQQTTEQYGFFSGLADGIRIIINAPLQLVTDWGWVRDGTGVYSSPSSGGYKAGYAVAVSFELAAMYDGLLGNGEKEGPKKTRKRRHAVATAGL